MHFTNARTDSHHIVHAPGHRSPPPPLGPPHLYNLNHSSSSPPVFLKIHSSPRPQEHSPLGHILHHSYAVAHDGAGSARSASPSSPQLQPRSVSEAQQSSSYAPLSPATPMDNHRVAHRGNNSPLLHLAATMTPSQAVSTVHPLSPSSDPAWLSSSKSLKRGIRTEAPLTSSSSETQREGGADAVQQVRQYLQFSPMSTQMPSLQSGGTVGGGVLPTRLTSPAPHDERSPLRLGSSPRNSFEATRRGSDEHVGDERRAYILSPQPRGTVAPTTEPALRLEAMIAVHIRDAEQHHREAIVESFVAAFQEMRLDSMMQRNVMGRETHKRSAKIQSVLSQSPTRSPRTAPQDSATMSTGGSTTWMARPQLGFPEAAQPRALSVLSSEHYPPPMSRSASESLQALRGRLSYATDDVTTPLKQQGISTGESPYNAYGGHSANAAYRSSGRIPLAQQTPRTMASKNAVEALSRVLQDEERSRRILMEASSTNASVMLRQIFHCWIRGLHPTTLYVQEQHSFNTLMSAFEEESITVHEQYQRWLWEQRAERIQFWTKRLATLRMDEDRSRENETILQRDLWTEMMRRAELGRQQIMRDTIDEQLRVESRLRRSVATLVALEATIRDDIVVQQEQLRSQIVSTEDEAFHCSLGSMTKLGAMVTEERTVRSALDDEERRQRREVEQMRKWSAPLIAKALPVVVPGVAVSSSMISSPEGSPKSDRPLMGEDPLSVVSLEDSGYFLTHGEDQQNEHSQHQNRTPRRRRSPTTNRRHITPIAANEHYMRHTASSSRRQSSPGTTDRSPSQDNLFGGSFGELSQHQPPSDVAAAQQMHYDTASSVRLPTSSLASDAEGVPPPYRAQQAPSPQQHRVAVSPLQMQRTIDRLSKPKRRAEHLVDGNDELPSYTLSHHASSLASASSVHFTTTEERPVSSRRAQVNALSPSRQRASIAASSARRRSNGRDEPMSMPSMRPVVQGNSVMILRGGPAPAPRSASSKRSTTPAASGNSRTSDVRSARRYVDAFYAPPPSPQSHSVNNRDTSGTSIHLSQSPIVVSGHSMVSSEGGGFSSNNISASSQLPPTGRRVLQQRSHEEVITTTRSRPADNSGAQRIEKLSKWEAATLLMYEQSRRHH
ncbi:Hypothetical protein, putative [Bodo saltans]|uniref:Uncharacterized protein n=1 Tax=Bodo saltans TaxID=75058 RepID=A0A0S4J1Z8_BODSA|nr:Hypothetical protein, putative [Bodo saltans]|eukprot:CUG05471.1 Hypothetical protein, putative [Bodo saltans]